MPAQPTLFDMMGNDDPDLGSPHHDAAMFWLDRYIRSGKFIKTWLHGTDDNWKGYFDKRPELLSKSLELPPPPRPPHKLEKVEWEAPIDQRLFIDMKAVFTISYLEFEKAKRVQEKNPDTGLWEYRTIPDCWEVLFCNVDVCFEIKPKPIKSVGQLLRQLKTYRSKLPNALWFVVAPANPPVQEVLSREGFKYIQFPRIRELNDG